MKNQLSIPTPNIPNIEKKPLELRFRQFTKDDTLTDDIIHYFLGCGTGSTREIQTQFHDYQSTHLIREQRTLTNKNIQITQKPSLSQEIYYSRQSTHLIRDQHTPTNKKNPITLAKL